MCSAAAGTNLVACRFADANDPSFLLSILRGLQLPMAKLLRRDPDCERSANSYLSGVHGLCAG
jgi:hypothetical protein